jgi:DNA-binding transcriptional MerR regulator
MSLSQLAAEAGIPARTVRFYIARGLLDGPEVAGRGAAYGPGHLERLRLIRELQSRGLTLAEIGRELEGPSASLPAPSAWWQYQVSPDVVVSVRADLAPWRLKQVRSALEWMTARLAEKQKKEEE